MDNDILKRCVAAWNKDQSLQQVVDERWLEGFAKSEEVVKEIEMMVRDNTPLKAAESSEIYSNSAIKVLCELDGWTAILTRHDNISELINALPYPTVFGPVSSDSFCKVNIYSLPDELMASPSRCLETTVDLTRKLNLLENTFFAHSANEQCYRLLEQKAGTIYLRIAGPVRTPYIHSFNAVSLTYSHSSFANTEYTQSDMFSRFLKELVVGKVFANANKTEVEQAIDLVLFGLDKPDKFADSSRWQLMQALAGLDSEITIRELKKAATLSGELGFMARKCLEENNVD